MSSIKYTNEIGLFSHYFVVSVRFEWLSQPALIARRLAPQELAGVATSGVSNLHTVTSTHTRGVRSGCWNFLETQGVPGGAVAAVS